jgi:hypothetical protein
VDPETLNFVDGYTGTIVNRIVDHVNHDRATPVDSLDAKRNKARETARHNLEEEKFDWGQVFVRVALVIILAQNVLSLPNE